MVKKQHFDDSRIIFLKSTDGLPSLVTWLRTKSAILLVLTNGTVQINLVADHTKVIICPLKQAVTFVDKTRVFRTFKFSKLEQKGCPRSSTIALESPRRCSSRPWNAAVHPVSWTELFLEPFVVQTSLKLFLSFIAVVYNVIRIVSPIVVFCTHKLEVRRMYTIQTILIFKHSS